MTTHDRNFKKCDIQQLIFKINGHRSCNMFLKALKIKDPCPIMPV